MTVFTRSVGTFLMSRSEISLKESAVSRMVVISSAGMPSSPSRWRCVNVMSPPSSTLVHDLDQDLVLAVRLREQHLHVLAARGRQVLTDVVGADGQLAMTAVDQHGELDRLRAPEIDQCIHGRAH